MLFNKVLIIRLVLIITGCSSLINLNGQNLKKHKWDNRILIVKTSDVKAKQYQHQLKEFRNSDEDLMDRKIILYKVTGADFELIDYENSELNNSGKISGQLSETVLNKKENFEVILVGLDGGLKLQQTELLTKEDLFGIIDAMPMRRDALNRNETQN